eukprot:GHVT01102158.1.p2 GENE.GHVT01102158.1~~GHVT01102158.1.p2  ORF type:complete len:107 (+),score=3.93 GHVT01102158.1:3-323(+)
MAVCDLNPTFPTRRNCLYELECAAKGEEGRGRPAGPNTSEWIHSGQHIIVVGEQGYLKNAEDYKMLIFKQPNVPDYHIDYKIISRFVGDLNKMPSKTVSGWVEKEK